MQINGHIHTAKMIQNDTKYNISFEKEHNAYVYFIALMMRHFTLVVSFEGTHVFSSYC